MLLVNLHLRVPPNEIRKLTLKRRVSCSLNLPKISLNILTFIQYREVHDALESESELKFYFFNSFNQN